jgi:hypothetical protein
MTPKSLKVPLKLVNSTQTARIKKRTAKVQKTQKDALSWLGYSCISPKTSRVERKTGLSLSPQWHRLILARLLSQNNGVLLCCSCRSAVR